MIISTAEHLETIIQEMREIEKDYNEMESWIIDVWANMTDEQRDLIYSSVGAPPECVGIF